MTEPRLRCSNPACPGCEPGAACLGATEPGVQRGRYAVREPKDGTIVLSRTSGLCETCAGCECGEQAEPIVIPAHIAVMVRKAIAGKLRLPGVMARGRR